MAAVKERSGGALAGAPGAQKKKGGPSRHKGEIDPDRFFRKLLRVLDSLRVAYRIEHDEWHSTVRIPLDSEHLPERIYTPYYVGGRKWHIRGEYEREDRIDDFLQLLIERVAEKMGYESFTDLPYFEPLDLTWYFRIPKTPTASLEGVSE